ncbi:hypothetical protein Tco_0768549 [Tanacetum coccineum]
MKDSPQAQAVDPDIKAAKKLKASKGSKFANVTSSSKQNAQESQTTSSTQQQQHNYDRRSKGQEVDDDEVISDEASPEFFGRIEEKEDLMAQILDKEILVYLGAERDPNAPARYLWNKDLLYLNNGNTKAMKYILSLHTIHETPFKEDILEKCLTRWVDRVCVIWERIHDYQLGIESYQIKISHTAPTLIIPVMDIKELPKFCDATPKKKLMKVLEFSTEAHYGYKDPPLSEEDKEIMEFFEEEI